MCWQCWLFDAMFVCNVGLTWLQCLASSSMKLIYSEQQNHSTKGQISLVSQIVAQRTKGKLWEKEITKVGILSFVTPNHRSLVPAIGLIYILQDSTLDGTVLSLVLGLGSFCLYHSLYPLGHALQHIITTPLCHSIQSNHHLPPKHMYTK